MDGTWLPRDGRAPRELVLSFLDLARFTLILRKQPDDRSAEVIDRFYCLVHEAVDGSGGTVIKFLGDGALIVWPPDQADDALRGLIGLREATRAWAAREAWDTHLVARLHYGSVIAGMYGPPGHQHVDIIGSAVNVAARLEAQTLSVSAEAFRRLSAEGRQLLKKHTPPIVYIPLDDPRP